jgi:hypothetical protein
MDDIEKELQSKAIIRGRIYLFCPADALSVIAKCRETKRQILGIDAFRLLDGGRIQPVMAQSIDYSSGHYLFLNTDDVYWEAATKFITDRANEDYAFEVVYR